jgi:hypothetical protein
LSLIICLYPTLSVTPARRSDEILKTSLFIPVDFPYLFQAHLELFRESHVPIKDPESLSLHRTY